MFAECVVLYEHGFHRGVVTNSPLDSSIMRTGRSVYAIAITGTLPFPNGIHTNLIRDEQSEIAVIKILLLCICAARRRA